jgi:hypothetical protein
MKKKLMKVIKVLSLCLVLSLFVGVAVVSAQTAPANNVQGPLNVGPNLQSKSGSLRITNGGFRSAGPGLFDDIVIIGYSDGSAQTGGGDAASLPSTKKISFLEKLSNIFGLNTKQALAANPQCGNANGGTFTNVTNPSFTSGSTTYNLCPSNQSVLNFVGSGANTNYWRWTCHHIDLSNNTVGNINCSANKTAIVSGGVGEISGGAITPLTPSASTTYRLTVNGNSDLKGYTKVTGGLDVSGAVTSGGKNVCLQDGTNCAAASTVRQFGGTYTIKANDSSCVNTNPLASGCSCASGFTSYLMAEYSVMTSMANTSGYLVINKNSPVVPANLTSHGAGALVSSNYNVKMYGCYK